MSMSSSDSLKDCHEAAVSTHTSPSAHCIALGSNSRSDTPPTASSQTAVIHAVAGCVATPTTTTIISSTCGHPPPPQRPQPTDARRRIGTEHEKLGFNLTDNSRMDYDQISRVFDKLQERFGWAPIKEGPLTIGALLAAGFRGSLCMFAGCCIAQGRCWCTLEDDNVVRRAHHGSVRSTTTAAAMFTQPSPSANCLGVCRVCCTRTGCQLDGQSVTLEPGGQFELSGAPVTTLHQTCAEVNSHLYQVRACVG